MTTRAFRPAMCAAVGLVLLGGCGLLPWYAESEAPAVPVTELLESAADGTPAQAFPQYWKRNTLVIDMRAAASAGGTFLLKRRDGRPWPMRLALRVMPGSIGLVEVRADQRLLLPVTREGTAPVDLELAPGVYTQNTAQIEVTWHPAEPPSTQARAANAQSPGS